jgi:ribonuclease P/MRP protein subunit POP1
VTRRGLKHISGTPSVQRWSACGDIGLCVLNRSATCIALIELLHQAVTPTEKAFRPSHRASVHGSILHDASYYATIELKGPQGLLHAALETCCDPLASGMKRLGTRLPFSSFCSVFSRCMTGGRACETHIYKHYSYPFDLLGPITIICQPVSSQSELPPSDPPVPSGKGKGKGKEKEKQTESSSSPETKNQTRVIWVRTHPAVFEDVFEALQTSASYALHKSKEKDPKAHAEIEIADLRGSVNAFEIMGPMSSQVIKGVLSPVGSEDREDFKKVGNFDKMFVSSLTSNDI